MTVWERKMNETVTGTFDLSKKIYQVSDLVEGETRRKYLKDFEILVDEVYKLRDKLHETWSAIEGHVCSMEKESYQQGFQAGYEKAWSEIKCGERV